MNKKLVVEISEGLGNQLFMYAHAFSVAQKLDYELLIDNKSAYSLKKNILREHQKYMLDLFNINQNLATKKLIYDNKYKKILKKISILLDILRYKKKFLKEENIKINKKKIAKNYSELLKDNFSDIIYVQGNFENYEYFSKFQDELANFFTVKKELINHDKELVKKLISTNSISLHVRRNRFSDQIGLTDTKKNQIKSDFFTNQIIEYINRSINLIEKKVQNPQYFIWTNDCDNFEQFSNRLIIKKYNLINESVINDFDLFQYAKHFIVGPSSFHWWGAWLNKNPNKICIRPSDMNPSNNEGFWPKDWISI